MTEKLKTKILETITNDSRIQIEQEIEGLDTVELLIWLGEQDDSIRYHLALELDIPLQHLAHTCSTLKQIHNL